MLRELDVGVLCVHRLGDRGGHDLPAAAAVDELIQLAAQQGTDVIEPFAGAHAFGGALRVIGPTEAYYNQLVAQQVAAVGARAAPGLIEAARRFGRRFLDALPGEVWFDDAGGTNPRNNSSVITMLEVDGVRMLFTADAGVPALNNAWDYLEANGHNNDPPRFVQMPHHGSRRNASSDLLNRILGPTGQAQAKTSFVNVAPEAVKHPSARVANGFMRRGYVVCETKGDPIRFKSSDAPRREGWGPLEPLRPMDESEEE